MLDGYVHVALVSPTALISSSKAAIEAGHDISKHEALALGSSNIEKLLGAKPSFDLVATVGGDVLDMSAKIVGIISVERGIVDLI